MYGLPYKVVSEALSFAIIAHEGQFRKNGVTPYIVHPIGVADIVYENGGDQAQIIAALFHDIIEDCGTEECTAEQYLDLITAGWGHEVARMVTDLTNTSKAMAPHLNRAMRKQMDAERLMEIGYAAQLVKLADILYNVGDLDALENGFARKFLKEKQNQVDHIVRSWGMEMPKHQKLANRCYNMIDLQLARLDDRLKEGVKNFELPKPVKGFA
jgi:(p)ppGpp synthase/HD superfamily hydrolase